MIKLFKGNGTIAALVKAVQMSEPSDLAGFLSGFQYTSPPLAGNMNPQIWQDSCLVSSTHPDH